MDKRKNTTLSMTLNPEESKESQYIEDANRLAAEIISTQYEQANSPRSFEVIMRTNISSAKRYKKEKPDQARAESR